MSSRNEKILEALLNGETPDVAPQSRNEAYMLALCQQGGGSGSGGGGGDSGGNADLSITGATVGQTVKITEVDENGVPTAWESVDFPSGKKLVGSITLTENVTSVEFELEKPCNELVIFVKWSGYALIGEDGTGKTNSRLSFSINDLKCTWCSGTLADGTNRAVTIDIKMSTSGHVSCRGSNATHYGDEYSTSITEFPAKITSEAINKISLYASNTAYLINSGVEIVVMGA